MRQLFCPRRAGIAVTVIALALSAQAPAVAAPSDESPESVALAYPTSPCDPSGPTSADAALAAQLNSQLQAKMRGYMTAYRVSCARMVTKAVRDRGLEVRAAAIAITTTIVETSIQNINIEVDHDSLGLFQQRASWGSRAQRLDPTWATNAFLNKMLSSFPNGSWKTAPIGQVCQTVQVSAYPDRYAVEAGDGVKIANALWSLLDLPAADDGSVQFADLTGDGLDEIISVRPDGRVYAYRNRGWSDPSVYTGSDSRLVAEGFHDPLRTKFADINGDGRDEIISLYADGDVHAYINQGWTATKVYDGGNQRVVAEGFTDPLRTKFADINGDGRDEIISLYADGDVHAYINQGWTATNVYDGANQRIVAQGFTDGPRTKFADINGDGRDEIISLFTNGDVHAYINQGWTATNVYDGANQRIVAQGFTDPRPTKFATINGDTRAEIIAIYHNGDVHAYINQGWTATNVYHGTNQRIVAQGFTI